MMTRHKDTPNLDRAVPARAFLSLARFVQATVRHIDLERRVVRATAAGGTEDELPYD
jgi:NADH dehydrogenase FAD-containing subunit